MRVALSRCPLSEIHLSQWLVMMGSNKVTNWKVELLWRCWLPLLYPILVSRKSLHWSLGRASISRNDCIYVLNRFLLLEMLSVYLTHFALFCVLGSSHELNIVSEAKLANCSAIYLDCAVDVFGVSFIMLDWNMSKDCLWRKSYLP